MMSPLPLLLIPLLLGTSTPQLDKSALDQIGLQIWQNECRGTCDGLISWSPAEEFLSLGLGHFIWYPKGKTGPYEEGFPKLVAFLKDTCKEAGTTIPSWIGSKGGFPWKSRESFLKDKRSPKMRELREFLSATLDLQVLFLFKRFEQADAEILPLLDPMQKEHYAALKSSHQGMYALIDYVNFKGFGTSAKERYRGQGWGLLQVLQNLPQNIPSEKILEAFVASAKQILDRRVKHAPAARNEKQFLKGWFKRLETYTGGPHVPPILQKSASTLPR